MRTHVAALGLGFSVTLTLAWACSSTSTNDSESATGGTGGATGGTASGAAGGAAGSDAAGGAAGWDASTGGSAGSTPDAAPDAKQDAVLQPSCPGFVFEPTTPESDGFNIFFRAQTGYVCIKFSVQCPAPAVANTTDIKFENLPPSVCLGYQGCWGKLVTGCGVGKATATFFQNVQNSASAPCASMTPAGQEVASCTFDVVQGL